MPADLPPSSICEVVRVHDGDGPLWCTGGVKVRVAGIQAPDFESAQPCRLHDLNYQCDDAAARRSKQIVERLGLNRRLTCQPVNRSYKRAMLTEMRRVEE